MTDQLTDQLADWLMPSVNHVVMTDKTRDLISSLLYIILSQDILFANQKGYILVLWYNLCLPLYPVPFLTDQVGDDLQ